MEAKHKWLCEAVSMAFMTVLLSTYVSLPYLTDDGAGNQRFSFYFLALLDLGRLDQNSEVYTSNLFTLQ